MIPTTPTQCDAATEFEERTGTAIQLAAESSDNATSRKWVAELSSYVDRVETISG